MTQTKTRFDITYIGTPGAERLTVKCNFPEVEKRAVHTSRVYFGPRAVKRMKEIQRLLKKGDQVMEEYIINDCKVGSSVMNIAQLNAALMPRSSHAENVLRNLGALQMPEVKLP